MNFKEFATNYLNPIFIIYRSAILAAAFMIFIFSLPMFTASASRNDMMLILATAIGLSLGLYVIFRRRAYLLYLVIPLLLVIIAFSIRGAGVVQVGVLIFPMAMCWSASFLLVFNGFRSWGYGISGNDVGKSVQDRINRVK